MPNSRATSSARSRCALAIATMRASLQFLKPGICVVRANPAPIIPMRMVLSAIIYPVLVKVNMLAGSVAKRLGGVDVFLVEVDLCTGALRRPREFFGQQRRRASNDALSLILTESK